MSRSISLSCRNGFSLKLVVQSLTTAGVGLFACCAGAAVLYVDANASNPTPPYADWQSAATTIQDAFDASTPGDLIWVTNGVYQIGGRPLDGSVLTNRVLIDKAVTVQSVNGPTQTSIEGYQVPGTVNGTNAVRGAYLADGAQLVGFTIENGATLLETNAIRIDDDHGGGVRCQSTNALVSNCVVISNSCANYGAGVYSGTLTGCQVNYNAIKCAESFGGGAAAFAVLSDSTINSNYFSGIGGEDAAGAYGCTLSNCVISGNLRSGVTKSFLVNCIVANNTNSNRGGGAVNSTLSHCLVYGNQTAGTGGGVCDSVLNSCTVSNNWAGHNGGGVYDDILLTNAPGMDNILVGNVSGGYGGGLYFASGSGNPNWTVMTWSFITNSATRDGGGLYLGSIYSSVSNCVFTGNSSGGNGGGFCPNSNSSGIPIANSTFIGNIAVGSGGGAYNASLGNGIVIGNQAGGSGGGVYGYVSNCVVNGNSATGNGGGFYFSGVTGLGISPDCGFTNNTAMNGGAAYGGNFTNSAFVGNSALTNGGAVDIGSLSHCLVISNQASFGGGANSGPHYPLTQNTFIACEFIGNTASMDGGGVYSTFATPTAGTNCDFTGNSALRNGGATFQVGSGSGTMSGNSALNGGASYGATLYRYLLFSNTAAGNGGAAYNGSVQYCVLSNNVAVTNGGGSYNATLVNSLACDNSAANGGGAYLGSLSCSTIAANTATVAGGGTYYPTGGSIVGCIIYDNTAPTGSNYLSAAAYTYCCLAPLPPAGSGNIASDPAFINVAARNFRLQTNSPCIDLGSGGQGIVDLDGRRRLVGRIDMGAYEFQGPGMGEFTAWLQQHDLPTDGSADGLDTDGDGLSNWQEWVAGTDPTNSTSVLKMMAPSFSSDASGVTLTWQSVSDRTYFLQKSIDLSAPFSTIQSNIVGQSGTTTCTDTNAVETAPSFYRVGVE